MVLVYVRGGYERKYRETRRHKSNCRGVNLKLTRESSLYEKYKNWSEDEGCWVCKNAKSEKCLKRQGRA